MKAIVITAYGGPEVLSVAELPDPVPAAGEVLIRVRAFGLNHAETYMRSGAWGTVAQVTGIECAGTVQADPNGRLAAGTPVIAILGGMGRTRNGSYAELVTVPAGNVVPVSTALPWTDLVALPEVYATAWAGLHQNLGLRPGQTVLVRGATSALGQAAVNIAAEDGVTVIATTRSAGQADLLRGIGAASVLIDDGALADQVVRLNLRVDGVFDLVGNSALRDSLRIARPGGRVCQLGFLGGLEPVADRRRSDKRPVQLLRQRVRARHRELPAGRYPAAGNDHQGGERAVPGQACEGVRLRGDRGGAPGDGAGPGRRKDGRRGELVTARGVRPAEAW